MFIPTYVGKTIREFAVIFVFTQTFYFRVTMAKWLWVLSTAVIGGCVFYLRTTTAMDNSSTSAIKYLQREAENKNQTLTFLTAAWIFDPLYIIPANGSSIQEEGMIRGALLPVT